MEKYRSSNSYTRPGFSAEDTLRHWVKMDKPRRPRLSLAAAPQAEASLRRWLASERLQYGMRDEPKAL